MLSTPTLKKVTFTTHTNTHATDRSHYNEYKEDPIDNIEDNSFSHIVCIDAHLVAHNSHNVPDLPNEVDSPSDTSHTIGEVDNITHNNAPDIPDTFEDIPDCTYLHSENNQHIDKAYRIAMAQLPLAEVLPRKNASTHFRKTRPLYL